MDIINWALQIGGLAIMLAVFWVCWGVITSDSFAFGKDDDTDDS